MNKRTILYISMTLIVGFVIGFFVAGRWSKHRMHERFRLMNDPHQQAEHLMNRLEFSTEQRDLLQPSIDSMIRRKVELVHEHHREMHALNKEMHQELMPQLSPEQRDKLRRIESRRERRLRQTRSNSPNKNL